MPLNNDATTVVTNDSPEQRDEGRPGLDRSA